MIQKKNINQSGERGQPPLFDLAQLRLVKKSATQKRFESIEEYEVIQVLQSNIRIFYKQIVEITPQNSSNQRYSIDISLQKPPYDLRLIKVEWRRICKSQGVVSYSREAVNMNNIKVLIVWQDLRCRENYTSLFQGCLVLHDNSTIESIQKEYLNSSPTPEFILYIKPNSKAMKQLKENMQSSS